VLPGSYNATSFLLRYRGTEIALGRVTAIEDLMAEAVVAGHLGTMGEEGSERFQTCRVAGPEKKFPSVLVDNKNGFAAFEAGASSLRAGLVRRRGDPLKRPSTKSVGATTEYPELVKMATVSEPGV
jgi:hypothetical protein